MLGFVLQKKKLTLNITEFQSIPHYLSITLIKMHLCQNSSDKFDFRHQISRKISESNNFLELQEHKIICLTLYFSAKDDHEGNEDNNTFN